MRITRTPYETHRTPVPSKMLAEHILGHSPDRRCHRRNAVGRDHGRAAIKLQITLHYGPVTKALAAGVPLRVSGDVG
jgi:hypothetical protein